jgi:hypothetical protein
MSLILEALKKSEAKRRLGEAPDLATPFATTRRRSSVLPLLAVVILGAGALGWWLLRAPAPATKPPAAATTSPEKPLAISAKHGPATAVKTATPQATAAVKPMPPAVAAPAGGQAAVTQTAPGKTAAAQATAPVKPLPPAVVAPAGAQAAAAQTAPGKAAAADDNKLHGTLAGKKLPPNMRRVDKSEAGVAAQAEAPAAAKATPGTADVANTAKAPKTPDMRGLTPPDEAKPEAVEAAVASDAPKLAVPAAPAVVKNDVPYYYELPFNVRKALPPLRLNMHVYAATAAQRFVILNDLRLAEGDKTADEVTLREVRPDGAVLEFQGQRFFYPRDGM